jgi:hypothetical protein
MVEFLTDFSQNPVSLTMATSPWVVPTMQCVHIMALAIIFTSVLLIAMRLLGYAWGGQSVRQTVDRFTPWAVVSLVVLALTGLVMILAEPLREVLAISFWVKMALLAIAIAISVRFLRMVRTNSAYADATVDPDPDMRTMTIATVAVWLAIIFLGRFIAYDALIWGPLSPVGRI